MADIYKQVVEALNSQKVQLVEERDSYSKFEGVDTKWFSLRERVGQLLDRLKFGSDIELPTINISRQNDGGVCIDAETRSLRLYRKRNEHQKRKLEQYIESALQRGEMSFKKNRDYPLEFSYIVS